MSFKIVKFAEIFVTDSSANFLYSFSINVSNLLGFKNFSVRMKLLNFLKKFGLKGEGNAKTCSSCCYG
jgi:hypothetical protein